MKTLILKMLIRDHHLARNGFVHAASIVCLAGKVFYNCRLKRQDTACGFATFAHLPSDLHNFTTIELKSNFFGTCKEGDVLECEANLMHGGKSTQVWDAQVAFGEKIIAAFRCTQMILEPK